jgi:hypothetical protein
VRNSGLRRNECFCKEDILHCENRLSWQTSDCFKKDITTRDLKWGACVCLDFYRTSGFWRVISLWPNQYNVCWEMRRVLEVTRVIYKVFWWEAWFCYIMITSQG